MVGFEGSRADVEAAYDKTLSNIQVGEVVEGTVIGITKREVVVNIGYKSEGIIPVSEFRYNPDLAIGEKVEVYVESAEDKKGQLLLSHKKARQLKQVPYEGRYDRGCIRYRSLPPWIADRCETYSRLRYICRQNHGIQGG